MNNKVAIIAGIRTPFVKAQGAFSNLTAIDLASLTVETLLNKRKISASDIDELYFSSVLLNPRLPNFAREIVLRTSLPKSLPAHFVSNNCISGLVAVNSALEGILSGRISSAIAGGVESMSNPTLTLNKAAEQFFIRLAGARSFGEKIKVLSGFKPGFILPQAPSPKEPSTGLTMGEHCELMVKQFKIGRGEQDQIAFRSHKNADAARSAGLLNDELFAVNGIQSDNIIRADTSMEKLGKLKPVFDRSESGTITAGNSSPLTDGASAIFLASEDFARSKGYPILGYITAVKFTAIDPKDGLLMAPATAVPGLLAAKNISLRDIDLFEIHEAFGGQVACNLKAWQEGWTEKGLAPIGEIPAEKININGGSIAIGHPFAATGGRLILSAANSLNRSGKKRALLSICAAGAMAGAMLLESKD